MARPRLAEAFSSTAGALSVCAVRVPMVPFYLVLLIIAAASVFELNG